MHPLQKACWQLSWHGSFMFCKQILHSGSTSSFLAENCCCWAALDSSASYSHYISLSSKTLFLYSLLGIECWRAYTRLRPNRGNLAWLSSWSLRLYWMACSRSLSYCCSLATLSASAFALCSATAFSLANLSTSAYCSAFCYSWKTESP